MRKQIANRLGAAHWSVGHHFGGTTVDWFDRWTLGAMLLPAFEHYAQWNVPQHVGEFAVIGYADGKSPRSAFAWTRDSVELFEHCGAIWHLWNGGFGLGNKFVKEWLVQRKHRQQPPTGVCKPSGSPRRHREDGGSAHGLQVDSK